MENLKNLPVYRVLAGAVAVSCMLALLIYLLVLAPRQKSLRSSQEELRQLQQRVKRNDYPMDPQKLEKIRTELKNIQEGTDGQPGIEQINRKILQRAGHFYQEKIRRRYGSRRDFIQRGTRLDFQEEYDALMAAFRKMGIRPDSTQMGISDKSNSVYTYQLMLQLWTLDALRQCIAESGMSVHEVRRSGRKISQIAVLPMQSYLESSRKKEPFLLEFPVKVTLDGSYPQMRKLLSALIRDPFFLPVRHFEIFSLPPSGKQKKELVRLKLECAGYFTWEKQQE